MKSRDFPTCIICGEANKAPEKAENHQNDPKICEYVNLIKKSLTIRYWGNKSGRRAAVAPRFPMKRHESGMARLPSRRRPSRSHGVRRARRSFFHTNSFHGMTIWKNQCSHDTVAARGYRTGLPARQQPFQLGWKRAFAFHPFSRERMPEA